MIESIIDFILGPYGRMVSDFYIEHQFIINSIVLAVAFYKLFKNKSKGVCSEQAMKVHNEN
ncbi:hypothetical protein NSQ41_17615 [Aeribacillus sp. FSL K6-8210]|uniref:hypothetical protein n=1 Tax=Aeribacillus sp. FSL K6-8210 TaxID=2954683 RepID=UPI0030CCC8AC